MEMAHSGLTELIFSWTLNDILNPYLYQNKVERIPMTFSSVESYLNSFTSALIAETHAQMCSGMNAVYQALTCEIYNIAQPRSYMTNENTTYRVSFEAVDESRNKKEIYKPQCGDVILLTKVRPAQIKYFQRTPRSFVLGIVVKGVTDSIRTSKPVNTHQYKKEPLYAVYIMNTTTNIRIWEALKQDTLTWNTNILEGVLRADSMVGINCDHCSSQETYRTSIEDMDLDLQSFNLNESQTDAVISSVAASKCNHKNTIKLIWGPPGTGKTKTVATMLWVFLKVKCRTLICAPANNAVVEVTMRLLKLLKESIGHGGYGLGDIVLLGNEDRLTIADNKDLVDVFLDHRVKDLGKCLSEWKPCLDSMISLLKYPDTEYLLYLERTKKNQDEMQKEKEQKYEKETKERKESGEGHVQSYCEKEHEAGDKILTIGEFFRNQFGLIKESLKFCIRSWCTNLPTSFIPVGIIEGMKLTDDLLDCLGTLLLRDNVTTVELKIITSTELKKEFLALLNNIESPTFSDLLCKSRVECLRTLITLRRVCPIPAFGDTNLIREFCLQRACLIFCTVASSSTLLTEKMKPVKMLVIDEAAQLKECESTIPLQLPGIQHAILVGDECQLSATVISQICEDAGFGRSMFERLVLLGQKKHLLNVQYRMHPSISLFPNTQFYGNQILDAIHVKESTYRKQFLQGEMFGPYSFINVTYGKEALVNGNSPINPMESAVVSEIVAMLYEASVATTQKISVGVISPYKAQIFELQKKIGNKYDRMSNFCLSIRSIDGFQGAEEDVIIISLVRSNKDGKVGFLDKHQRTNVALTRARHCLWIVGNKQTLDDSNTIWKDLVLNAKDRGHIYNTEDDDRLAEGIVHAMIELGQLENLLNMSSFLFSTARWKVLFQDSFHKSCFERIKKVETRKEVVSLLKKLSNGWRESTHTRKSLNITNGTSSQLLRHNTINGGQLNVLWSVVVLEESSKYIQVLKFWDILPMTEIPGIAKWLNFMFRNYTEDDIYRCNFKCSDRDGEMEVPMSWEINPDVHLSTRIASLGLGEDPES